LRKPYKLILGGIVALIIIVAAALTSASWASDGAGFFLVIAFPVLLLCATFPLAVGGIALFRGYHLIHQLNMDLVSAAVALLIVGIVIWYVPSISWPRLVDYTGG
jgi:hypothetical protein